LGMRRRELGPKRQAFRQFLELVCQPNQILAKPPERFALGQAPQMRGPFAIMRRPVLYRVDDEL